jgi:hypothetical protein
MEESKLKKPKTSVIEPKEEIAQPDNSELISLLKEQSAKIAELEKRVMPQPLFVTNDKAPVYRLGVINNKIIKSIFNDKKVNVDDRGKAYVVQEFVVSFFGEDKPQRMSMTVYREMVKRIDTEFVRAIEGDKIDEISGKREIAAFELRAENPATGITETYIINKEFVNL